MVQASTLIVAAFAVTPILAAPLHRAPEQHTRYHPHHAAAVAERSIDELELAARDPKFNFGGLFKKIGHVAMKAAPLLLRDLEDAEDLDMRDLVLDEELAELAARDPKFNFGGLFKKIGHVAMKAAPLLLRDLEDGEDLDMRDLVLDEELTELAARDPKFNIGGFFKKVGHVAMKAAPLLLRDLEDGEELDMRDFVLDTETAELDVREPFNFKKLLGGAGKVAVGAAKLFLRDEEGNVYVYVRDVSDDFGSDLEAREPKFRLGGVLRKVGGFAGKALNTANRVAGAAGALGLREFEDGDYLEERDFDMDAEELDARRFNLGATLRKVKGAASKVLHVADQVSSKAHALGLREFDEDEMMMEARSIDDLD